MNKVAKMALVIITFMAVWVALDIFIVPDDPWWLGPTLAFVTGWLTGRLTYNYVFGRE